MDLVKKEKSAFSRGFKWGLLIGVILCAILIWRDYSAAEAGGWMDERHNCIDSIMSSGYCPYSEYFFDPLNFTFIYFPRGVMVFVISIALSTLYFKNKPLNRQI